MEKPSSLNQFIRLQRASVLEDFRTRTGTCLMATTHDRLLRLSNMYGWAVENIDRVSPSFAMVIRKPGSEPELWVRHGYGRYRHAFLRYLRAYYAVEAESLSDAWQVDHLHPSSRFTEAHRAYFIRLALIERRINSAYGAGYERLLYERERQRELHGGIHMDWMAILKIRGVALPSKADGTHGWQMWAWHQAKEMAKGGFDPVFTYSALTTLLNLGYTNIWRPLTPHPSFETEAQSFRSFACIPQLSETIS